MTDIPSPQTIAPEELGERLALSRKGRGLTQQQVADELGYARTTVVAIEKGDRPLRLEELVRFAALYGRQVGSLLRPSPIRSIDSFLVQFRSARTTGEGAAGDEREVDIDRFRQLCEQYVELERITESPLPRRYPEPYVVKGSEPEGAAAEVASAERNRLGLGDGPLGSFWELLDFDIGMRVFGIPFADHRLAGLFAWTDELGGCIAVNAHHPEERRRWSAAHELGHFLTDRFRAEIQVLPTYRRVPESERFAEAFARHFLMPSTGLVRRFQGIRRAKGAPITPADLLGLGQLYGVSFQALALRLEELKLLPPGAWDRLRAAGFKVNEAKAFLGLPSAPGQGRLLPRRYEALAVQAFNAGDISEGRLAQFLGTDRTGARRKVEELTDSRFDEAGEVRQMALDLNASLVGAAP